MTGSALAAAVVNAIGLANTVDRNDEIIAAQGDRQ